MYEAILYKIFRTYVVQTTQNKRTTSPVHREKVMQLHTSRLQKCKIPRSLNGICIEAAILERDVGRQPWIAGHSSTHPEVLCHDAQPLNMAANLLTKMRLLKSPKREMTILDDVSGVLQPRRLTLLLGPPSAGKTTLLKALAGKLRGVQVSPSLRLQG